MSIPAIIQATKDRVKTTKATYPKPNPGDTNIGKVSHMLSGPYKGLEGIIYPKREGVRYLGEFGKGFIGTHTDYAVSPYILMLFYDDGTPFCGVAAEYSDLYVPGGVDPTPPADGTLARPFPIPFSMTGNHPYSGIVFQLPKEPGDIDLVFDPTGAWSPINIKIYFVNDLVNPIAKTTTAPVGGLDGYTNAGGKLRFYNDPAYNADKIVVSINGDLKVQDNILFNFKIHKRYPDGTSGYPYLCGKTVLASGKTITYYQLPEVTGKSRLWMDFNVFNGNGQMTVYYLGDSVHRIAAVTNVIGGGSGSVNFEYDPAVNPPIIFVKTNEDVPDNWTNTTISFKLDCHVQSI